MLLMFISQEKRLFKCFMIILEKSLYEFMNRIYESRQGKGLKTLTPKQMLQRSPIALAQIKAGNNSESLLNEIRQIVYSLHQSKDYQYKIINTKLTKLNL